MRQHLQTCAFCHCLEALMMLRLMLEEPLYG